MIPEWLTANDNYEPPEKGGSFSVKTIKSMGESMAKVKIQAGQEGKIKIPALLKLFILLAYIILVAVFRNTLAVMGLAAGLLLLLCFMPSKLMWRITKPSLMAGLVGVVFVAPAILINPALKQNSIMLVVKILLSVLAVNIFNNTTQWNHITGALRRLHIPGVFIFILDITLKYIVLLGNFISEILTSLELRSVGKNNRKYSSVGGVMGVTFIRGSEMNTQMYEAMQCRGFTDDYKGL